MGFLSYLEEHKRNAASSLIAGILFFSGWWIIFDVAGRYPMSEDFAHVYHIVGVFSTVGFVLVNMVPNSAIRGDIYAAGCCGICVARTVLFFGFLSAFAAIIAATWILFEFYAETDSTKPTLAGVGLFFQNMLIFSATMIFKFGRVDDDSNFY